MTESVRLIDPTFEQIFDQFPNPLILIHQDGKIIYINPKTSDVFGYANAEFIGKKLYELKFFPQESLTIIFRSFKELIKTKLPKEVEISITKKDGSLVWENFVISILKIENKELIQVHATDISDKKRKEQELNEVEKKYFHLFNNLPFAVWILDLKGKVLDCNSYTDKLFPLFKCRELIGKNLLDLSDIYTKIKHQIKTSPNISPEDFKKLIRARVVKLLSGQKITPLELHFKNKDGSKTWLKFHSSLINIENQKLIQVTIEDISESHEMRDKIKKSQENYSFISENANDMIAIINKKVQLEFVSEGPLKRILGYDVEDMVNKRLARFIHPNDVTATYRAFFEGVKKGENAIEIRFKNKQNKYVWLEIKGKWYEERGVIISRDITERKKFEEALIKSEMRQKLILENLNDMIYIIDEKLNAEYINESVFINQLGYSFEDVTKLNPLHAVHPDDYQKAIKAIRNGIKRGSGSVDLRLRGKKGNYMIYHLTGKFFIDIDGLQKVLIISNDITAQKEFERKLIESEERYRLITENSSDLIRIFDNKFKIKYINKAHFEILRYTNDELIGTTARKITHPDEKEAVNNFVKTLLKEGEARRIGRIRHKNGNWKWFDIWTKLIPDSKNIFRGLVISRDITQRRELELKLKKSEEMYRLIAEGASDLIHVTDINYEIEYINKEAHQKVLGYTLKDLEKGRRGFFIHPDEVKDVLEMNKKVVKTGEGSREGRYKHKNGAWLWFEIQATKIVDEKGKINILVLSRDISRRKMIDDLIKEENKKLKQLDDLRKEFVNRASHELKTPLTSISGAIQLIPKISGQPFNTQTLELLDIAASGCERLKTLIYNILDISRLDNFAFELKRKPENIVSIIIECVKEMKYLINEKGIVMSVNTPKEVLITLDKSRIEQVIINLLSNAVKNTQVDGEIKIKLVKWNQYIEFSIQDTGIGITKSEMIKLFKRFGKVERILREDDIDLEGSGLGLYISKEIVEHHGGKIWVESKGRNKGATFYFRIPFDIDY